MTTEPDEQSGPESQVEVNEPKRRVGVLALVAVVIVILDIVTKVIALAALEGSEPVRLLGGAVYLQIVRNPGAAFGMATGMTWLLSLIMIAVIIAILVLARKLRSAGWAFGLGLILAGAFGNLIDRIFRAPGPLQGHVVDFVSVFAPDGRIWPVFNVADSSIVVGGILIVLLSLLGRDYDGRRATRRGRDGGDAEEARS
ncbi:signal peptidase II [Tamaricihabitans halophyticus]|uniref:Lipoprotein signal peptidase n=1 Tax=Tamaricihabitans halophyticus TaxID=1262583 RepID=A0A4R2Q969_9PSEU|nr:signal peptidase II [Tamaricihabitans halophyticus]TCP45437.1 signal peptidase II [Tamaricihabitans halophyticus]